MGSRSMNIGIPSKLTSLLCALVLIVSMVPALAFAGSDGEGDSMDVDSITVDSSAIDPVTEVTVDPGSITLDISSDKGFGSTSADSSIATLSLADGKVDYLDNDEMRFIDRMDVPEYAHTFYDALVEASDGDGVDDYLIEDRYFQQGPDTSHGPDDLGRFARFTSGPTKINGIMAAAIPVTVSDSLQVSKYMRNVVNATIDAFLRDHPEVFWLDDQCTITWHTKSDVLYCFLVLNEFSGDTTMDLRVAPYDSQAALEAEMQRFERAISGILGNMPEGDLDRLAYFDRWLGEHNVYATGDLEKWINHSPLSAMYGTSGEEGPVCEAYARAFKILCDRAGIQCTTVIGRTSENVLHMWDAVRLDDAWYVIDPTADDSGYSTLPNYFFLIGTSSMRYARTVTDASTVTISAVNYEELSYPEPPDELMTGTRISLSPILVPAFNIQGKGSFEYRITSGALPDGLSLNASTGVISGTLRSDIETAYTVTVALFQSGLECAKADVAFGGETTDPGIDPGTDPDPDPDPDPGPGTDPTPGPTEPVAKQVMYRLYNPNSGEHFYTASLSERNNVMRAGWRYEGIGWTAPVKSQTPVYRLYSGTDHHYTMSASERDNLIRVGWRYEGIGWFSDDAKGVPLYRQFNPNVDPRAPRNNSGSHNYTTSKAENDHLVRVGWRAEGIGWYGVK